MSHKERSLPKISVVLATLNAADGMDFAIQSLLKQNYPNIELIVLDGGSTDGTLGVIEKYKDIITYWRSSPDKGNCAAQTEGIEKCTGDIICILNAHDYFYPDVFHFVAEQFQNDDTLEVVSLLTTIEERNPRDDTFKLLTQHTYEQVDFEHWKMPRAYSINSRFFHKRVFEKYGLPLYQVTDDIKFIANDLEFMLRLAYYGAKNVTFDKNAYSYVLHDDSCTFSPSYEQRKYFELVWVALMYLAKDIPESWQKELNKWVVKYTAHFLLTPNISNLTLETLNVPAKFNKGISFYVFKLRIKRGLRKVRRFFYNLFHPHKRKAALP